MFGTFLLPVRSRESEYVSILVEYITIYVYIYFNSHSAYTTSGCTWHCIIFISTLPILRTCHTCSIREYHNFLTSKYNNIRHYVLLSTLKTSHHLTRLHFSLLIYTKSHSIAKLLLHLQLHSHKFYDLLRHILSHHWTHHKIYCCHCVWQLLLIIYSY